MAYNTFRTKDMEAERELAKYLDKHLYTKPIFTRAERTDNAITQMEGSDIIVSIPSLGIENAVVDEKSAIHYINGDLKTFVLEISFLNSGYHFSEGWFIDDTLSTDYYLIQWLKGDVNHWTEIKEGNLTEVECVLVSKAKLKAYFESEGYTKERLLQISKEIRNGNNVSVPYGKPYRFHFSYKLAEKPVNILLNKEEYIRLGEFHAFVRP